MKPKIAIEDFDRFLSEKGLSFQGVLIGAAALNLLGAISRETRDCDILDPKIPEQIKQAASEFAAIKRKEGWNLKDDWLNNGPEDLKRDLPKGWLRRSASVFKGKALLLSVPAREDLLNSKLFAYCDRGQDLEDCLALKPSRKELLDALPWVKERDANPDWPKHVQIAFGKLAKRLGYEL